MDERGSGTHPGIAVMRAFLTGTAPVLRKLLKIFVQPYDWESLPYAKQIEEAVLLALKVLYRVMLNDASFLNQLRLAPKSEQDLATPIDKLLLRERSDIIRILKHAGQESNPLIALYAVRITSLLSERIPAMLVTIILDSKEGPAIKQAFVARLDDPVTLPVQREPEEDLPADDDDAQAIQQELREATHATREAIIHLMTHNLDNALPTIAHFLLGFDVSQRSFDKNDLVRSQPSCFHSILRLLVDATLSTTNASLIASCYELIHNLCANIQTYRPVLKALQSKQYDFFMKQIYRLPKQTTPQAAAHQLEQWSWFLKTVALKIHLTASQDQRMETQNLLAELFISTPEDQEPEDQFYQGEEHDGQHRMRMLEILNELEIENKEPQRIPMSKADEGLVAQCYTQYEGVKVIDIESLNDLLRQRQRDDAASGIAHYTQQEKSVQDILEYAVEANKYNILQASKQSLVEGWARVVQVTLLQANHHLFRIAGDTILYSLLESLLSILNTSSLSTAIADPLSSVVLFLMTKLRELKLYNPTTALEGAWGAYLPADQLRRILRILLEALGRHSTSVFMRGNLYVTLLHYLQLTRPELADETAPPELRDHHQKLHKQNLAILEAAGDRLIDILCNDATYSAEMHKSIAFSLLNSLVALPESPKALRFMHKHGHLAQFVRIFTDEVYLTLLHPSSVNLKQLHVYEMTTSLLERTAQSADGALMLIDNNLFLYLTTCSFIDRRPDDFATRPLWGGETEGGWFPGPRERYHSMLLPILRLVLATIVSLPGNNDAHLQALEFVATYTELFQTILKEALSPSASEATLEEAALLSALFYRFSLMLELMEEALQDSFRRYQRLLIRFLRVYPATALHLNSTNSNKMRDDGDDGDYDDYDKNDLLTDTPNIHDPSSRALEISRNVIAFCRVITDQYSHQTKTLFRPLFSPTYLTPDQQSVALSNVRTNRSDSNEPTLGCLVDVLELCVECYHNPRTASDKTSALYTLENTAVILSRHLEYFLAAGAASTARVGSTTVPSSSSRQEPPRGGALGASERETLQQEGLVRHVPQILKQLRGIESHYATTHPGNSLHLILSRLDDATRRHTN
eukprot:TRINITY_DN4630_c0_g1_i5.p1 TRINITY_DN4630_c0_g1~~TRINITY_DN4630_c0_g1_i5.p1  ORF type:complete len:1094 (+),score=127.99 TRINITY_DN4630_c0_g1_i5:367-3648(+)